MNRKLIILPLVVLFPLTSCNNEEMYDLAYRGVAKLQSLIDNPNDIYIKHVFHGEPPIQTYGTIVLMIYTIPVAGQLEDDLYFAYETEDIYFVGLDAVPLYEYREYYFELDVDTINAHFGFENV